jgi:hypothetical protein
MVRHSVLDQEKGAAAAGTASFLEVTLSRAAIVISCGPGAVEVVGARPSFLRRRIGAGNRLGSGPPNPLFWLPFSDRDCQLCGLDVRGCDRA